MLRPLLQTAAASPAPKAAAARAFSLAYEWIVDGKVVPAAMHDRVPEKYGDREVIVFLHGLLGNAKVGSLSVAFVDLQI